MSQNHYAGVRNSTQQTRNRYRTPPTSEDVRDFNRIMQGDDSPNPKQNPPPRTPKR